MNENEKVNTLLQKFFGTNTSLIDCTNLHTLLSSLNSSTRVYKFADNLKMYVEGKHPNKWANQKKRYYAANFVNKSSKKYCGCWHINSHPERIQSAIIMEYYYPGYLDDTLLPYINQNCAGDKRRTEILFSRIIDLYNDGKVTKDVYDMYYKSYLDVKDIYQQDWENHFEAIKTIVAEIKVNQDQAQLANNV